MNEHMKILIGYDGSECADAALEDLKSAGLPKTAEFAGSLQFGGFLGKLSQEFAAKRARVRRFINSSRAIR